MMVVDVFFVDVVVVVVVDIVVASVVAGRMVAVIRTNHHRHYHHCGVSFDDWDWMIMTVFDGQTLLRLPWLLPFWELAGNSQSLVKLAR